ncbi:MAG: heparinase II/III family protein [Clostridia bacterium]|nr:heparinase II/III family protein [Clostridia bacterium]
MTYEEMYALLSNLPENRLPAALDVSLEEKRQQLLAKDVYKKYLAQMSDRAEQYRAEPATASPFSAFKLFETTGDRIEYNKYYFSNRGRMATFALMTWLYGREEDIHALEDALWAVCDEYTWCLPPHLAGTGLTKVQNGNHIIDLFAAETACAIGEILALVGEKLAPIVVKRARYLVQERVLERFLQVECNWEHAKSNWAAVCAGSVGMAAFYEAKDTEQLARITHRLQGAMESYVSSFPADGTSMEGISYWTYGFSFFASYAEMLLRMTKGAIDWFKDERVRQVALFQQKAYFENYNIIKFADCGKSDTAHWWGLTSYLKSRFDEIEFLPRDYYTDYPGDPYYRWAPFLRDLVWSDDTYPANNKSGKCYIQPDAQWLICNSKTGIGMAAKGGSNDETHNHNDVGHLQLFKNGDEVLVDCGSGNYTRDYFGPKRYNLFITGSQGHSVPVVDGCYQKAGAEYRAADVSFGEWFMEMDIAPAYGLENLRSLRRRIAFEEETGKVELTDTYDFSAPAWEIVERFISYSEPAFEEGKAILTGPKSVTILCFDPALEPSVTVENPARAGNNSDVAGKPVYVLDFKAKKPETKCTFTFTIV